MPFLLLIQCVTAQAAEKPAVRLSPIYRIQTKAGQDQLVTQLPAGSVSATQQPAFFAVCVNQWPAGLVPLFVLEKDDRIELRRRPPRGQENFTEPLFFAFPCEDEPIAAKIAGTWDCLAIREDRSKAYVVWELGVADEKIFGRFDQNTDYRFAFITGGSLRTNRFDLRVEYVKDGYLLTGKWRSNKLSGEWRREDSSERGTWQATRTSARLPSTTGLVALYEWRRAADGVCRYALQGKTIDSAWNRSARPLCRVWRGPQSPK